MEYCRLQREGDIVEFFKRISSGTCVDASAKLPRDGDEIVEEIITEFSHEQVNALIHAKNENTVGFYSAHVFVALDFRSAYSTSLMSYIPFKARTIKLQLRPYDLMLEYKRYHILDNALYKKYFLFGRYFRDSFLDFSGYSTRIACEKALDRNDARACELIVPALNEDFYPNVCKEKVKSLLEKVFQHNISVECLDVLIPFFKSRKSFREYERKNILDVIQRNPGNRIVLQSLLRHEVFSVSTCLRIAVEKAMIDEVFVTAMIDEDRYMVKAANLIKDHYFLQEQKCGVPLLVQATLNDSHCMLRVLLADHPCRLKTEWCGSKNTLVYTYGGYSVVRLARALEFTQCLETLMDAGIPDDVDNEQSIPVLDFIFDIKSVKYSNHELSQRLAKSGFGINTCIEIGFSKFPLLYYFIVKKELGMIQTLLAAGAALFGVKDVTVYGCPPRLVAEFIQYNADICTDKGSVLNRILEYQNSNQENLLHLVLNCAHTIPRTDRDKLQKLSEDMTFCGYQKISEFLTSPRRLTLLSRDALRRHYGHLIHDYLATQYLPSVVVDFLKCKEALKPFLESPLEFTQAFIPMKNHDFVCFFPENF